MAPNRKMLDDVGNDPAFELRWPVELFVEELDRLIVSGAAGAVDGDWYLEVQTLLRQAFSSKVPGQDFGQEWQRIAKEGQAAYDMDEEPF